MTLLQVPILVLDANKSKEEMVSTYMQFRDIIRGSQKLRSGVIYQPSDVGPDSAFTAECEKENVSQAQKVVVSAEGQR